MCRKVKFLHFAKDQSINKNEAAVFISQFGHRQSF